MVLVMSFFLIGSTTDLCAQRGFQELFQWSSVPPAWSFGGDSATVISIFSPQKYPQAYEISTNPPVEKKGLIIGVADTLVNPHRVFADLTTYWEVNPMGLSLSYRILGQHTSQADGIYLSADSGKSFNQILSFSPVSRDSFKTEVIAFMMNEALNDFNAPGTLIFRFQKEVHGPINAEDSPERDGLWLESLNMGDMSYYRAMSNGTAPDNSAYAPTRPEHSVAGLIRKPLRKYQFWVFESDSSIHDKSAGRGWQNLPDTVASDERPLIMTLPVSGWDVNRENAVASMFDFHVLDSLPRIEVVEGPSLEELIEAHDDSSISMTNFVLAAAQKRGAAYIYHVQIDTVALETMQDAAGSVTNVDVILTANQYLIRVSDGMVQVATATERTNSNAKLRAANTFAGLGAAVAATSGNASTASLGRETLNATMTGNGAEQIWGNSDIISKLRTVMAKINDAPLSFLSKALLVRGEVYGFTPYRKPLFKGYEIEISLGTTHGLQGGAGMFEAVASKVGLSDGHKHLTSRVAFVKSGTDTPLALGKVVQVDENKALVRISEKEAGPLVGLLESQISGLYVMPSYP